MDVSQTLEQKILYDPESCLHKNVHYACFEKSFILNKRAKNKLVSRSISLEESISDEKLSANTEQKASKRFSEAMN
ncbi:hypothetical protein M0802_015257 [Mischocyttarus mexicanus]|nr:hypothetical protein M0802_015257 [Mischocyttarus mexicanus]